MSRRRFPWDRLGIDETNDTGAIRRAYADALRATNVDEDIAGYADLRRARDQALWLAAQSQRAEEEDDRDLGLGDLDGDQDADADWFDDEDDDDLWDDGPSGYHPDPFVPAPAPGPALSEGQERARAAWQQLTGILYPEGAVSDDAVTSAELDEGLAALGALIARGQGSRHRRARRARRGARRSVRAHLAAFRAVRRARQCRVPLDGRSRLHRGAARADVPQSAPQGHALPR